MATLIPRYNEEKAAPYISLISYIHTKYNSLYSCAYSTHPKTNLSAENYNYSNLPSSFSVCTSPPRIKVIGDEYIHPCVFPEQNVQCIFFVLDLYSLYSIEVPIDGQTKSIELLRTRFSNGDLSYFFYDKTSSQILHESLVMLHNRPLSDSDSDAFMLFTSFISDLKEDFTSDDFIKNIDDINSSNPAKKSLISALLSRDE